MTIVRATCRMRRNSGVLNNDSVNVLHFQLGTNTFLTNATADALTTALTNFYSAFDEYLSPAVDRDFGSHEVTYAYVTSGGVGAADDVIAPVQFTKSFATNGTTSSAIAIPSECAVVLSYRGNVAGVPEDGPLNIRPRSRRRGRMYLGPWNVNAIEQVTSSHGLVAAGLRSAISTGYSGFITALSGLVQPIQHIVYSPTSDQQYATAFYHIDNAFDVLRSRGEPATVRTTGSVIQSEALNGPAD